VSLIQPTALLKADEIAPAVSDAAPLSHDHTSLTACRNHAHLLYIVTTAATTRKIPVVIQPSGVASITRFARIMPVRNA
jgi:hypothetical protein